MAKSYPKPVFISFFILLLSVALAGPPYGLSFDKKDGDKSQTADKQKAGDQIAQETKPHIEITVTAPRVDIALKQVPAATTVVETQIIQKIPRTIAIDEVMKLVPGVKVDNQAGG
jgi:outer membrane receptor protein involved in Fe transport